MSTRSLYFSIVAGMLILTGVALSAESQKIKLTKEQKATIIHNAKEYAQKHKIHLSKVEPTILAFSGKWYRVRLNLLGPPSGPIIRQLLISTDGQIMDSGKNTSVVKVLGEVLPSPKTDQERFRYLEYYILAISAYNTKVISKLEDIEGYEEHPLEKDFESVIRKPWVIDHGKGNKFYVFYTYTREGGTVKRWKCNFDQSTLWSTNVMSLGDAVGDAIIYQ